MVGLLPLKALLAILLTEVLVRLMLRPCAVPT